MYQIKRGDEVLRFNDHDHLLHFLWANVNFDRLDRHHFVLTADDLQFHFIKGQPGNVDDTINDIIIPLADKYGLTIEKVEDVPD